jgi:hypothetical protein
LSLHPQPKSWSIKWRWDSLPPKLLLPFVVDIFFSVPTAPCCSPDYDIDTCVRHLKLINDFFLGMQRFAPVQDKNMPKLSWETVEAPNRSWQQPRGTRSSYDGSQRQQLKHAPCLGIQEQQLYSLQSMSVGNV